MQREWAVKWIVSIAIGVIVLSALFFVLNLRDSIKISFGAGAVTARVADTEKEREKGLGGVDKLGDNEALLMVYDSPGKWAVDMENMRFNIDIVWVNPQRQIVDVVSNIAPSTYPNSFAPRSDAKYVLELPAGTAKRYNLHMGTQIVFGEGRW